MVYDIYAEESVEELPDEVTLDVEEDLDGDTSIKAIANYLRNTYNHYLSGKETQFYIALDANDDKVVYVGDIKWGRKR